MMRRSPLKPGKPLARKTPLKAAAFKRADRKEAGAVAKVRMKSRGMKGRPPTAEETRFMDAIASLGCVACAKDGWYSPVVSIHHIAGRTKPGAHMFVLPLCGPHHQQDDADPMGRISVHGNKARFEAKYGTQYELLAAAKERLGL
jgi:Recombination enhancement, RecA-dependent nuclease